MKPKVQPRDVGFVVERIRQILIGRTGQNPLRFEGGVVARSQPPPNLPEGPHHKLSANYYYSHDARRELNPPVLLSGGQALLPKAGETVSSKPRTPGKVFQWDGPCDL